jgi:hypothetical protein
VVAGVVAFLLSRGGGGGERGRAEERIRARWGAPAEAEAVAEDVAAYLARHGGEAGARAFASEAFLRVGRPSDALSAAVGADLSAAHPDALRAFARRHLRRIADAGGAAAARARLALAEGGDAEAAEAVRRAIAGATGIGPEVMPWFRTAALTGGPARTLVAEALRSHGDEDLRLAGATLLSSPRDRGDVDLLASRLDPAFRRRRFPTWRHVVRALGTTGDPRAVSALLAQRGALGAETGVDAAARETVEVGLALAGREEAHDAVLRASGSDPEGALYAYGLGVLRAQGDPTAVARLRALWDANPGLQTRMAIAFACFLDEAEPPEDVPRDAWLAALARTGSPLGAVLAPVLRWRRGEPGSTSETARVLAGLVREPQAAAPDADGLAGPSAALLEVLRSLARWRGPD